jgi:hypothetical protein
MEGIRQVTWGSFRPALIGGAIFLLSVPPLFSATVITVTSFPGVDPTGTTDSAAGLNKAIQSVSGPQKIVFPCGTYLVSRAINLPSYTEIAGAGASCTTIKMMSATSPNPNQIPGSSVRVSSVFTNEDFINGNSNIRIRDITLDGTQFSSNNGHLAFFYRSSATVVESNRFIGNPAIENGVAFVNSSNYQVIKNYAFNLRNACYDQWDGSHDFSVSNNVCDGNGMISYGILVNGLSSVYTPNTTYNGVIWNNTVSRVKGVGIFVGGLWNTSTTAPVYGTVSNIMISSNSVDTVTNHFGIYVTDGNDVRVILNTVKNTGLNGIRIGSQHQGATTYVTAHGNTVSDANARMASEDAIRVTNLSAQTSLFSNTVTGTRHRFAIRIDPGVSNTRLCPGTMTSGTAGLISDAGSGTVIRCNADNSPPAVTISNPPTGTVAGTVSIQATASDNVSVSSIVFLVNGVVKSTDTTTPHTYTWDTSLSLNGHYTLSVRAFDTTGNTALSAPVAVTVANPVPTLAVSPASIAFSASQGGANPAPLSVAIANSVAGSTLTWSVSESIPWLSASPLSGSGNGSVSLTPTITGLSTGAYTGAVTVTATNLNGATGSPATVIVSLTLLPDLDATFVSQSVPTTMVSGQVYPVSLTFLNTGALNWTHNATSTTSFRLGSQNPLVNTNWGLNTVPLTTGDDIATGQSKTFTFNVTAPAPGTVNFQWRLVLAWVQWFGGLSTNVPVNVTPDTLLPTVALTGPPSGNVAGTVSVQATASDNVGVSSVVFLVNGIVKATDTVAPYSFAWDTSALPNGSYTLATRAFDPAGNNALSAPVAVTVANTIPDTTPPTLSFISPAPGALLTGYTPLSVIAGDDRLLDRVVFDVDGVPVSTDTTAPYAFLWDTTGVAQGAHRLRARAYDASGNSTEQTLTVITPPQDRPTAFPNPYKGEGMLSFTGLTGGSRVTIFTLNGQKVRDLPVAVSGRADWDGRDENGRPVAAGIYRVRTDGPGGAKVFKVMVVR